MKRQKLAIIEMLQSSNNKQGFEADNNKKKKSRYDKSVKTGTDLGKSLTELNVQKWRILILDSACRDILTTLLKVGDLRALGITLVLGINDDRQHIPDTPAIYFVMPTEENIGLIVKDCENDLYESIHVNFAQSTPRALLEKFAHDLVMKECTNKITKVYDQFLNYRCIEKNFFSLDNIDTLSRLYDQSIKSEDDMMKRIDQIASGLVSASMAYESMPFICYQKGGNATAASMLGPLVEKKLRNISMSGVESTSSSSSNSKRPLLIILDRIIDFSVCLQHQWIYRPAVHDLFNIHLNRVTIPAKDNKDTKAMKVYDIEFDDEFWNKNKNKPFPQVAENVSTALEHHKEELTKFNSRTGLKIDEKELLSGTNSVMESKAGVLTKKVIDEVFQLAANRKKVEVHTNIAYAILQEVDSRSLDKFVSIEEALIQQQPLEKHVMLELLSSSANVNDRIRLLLICYLNFLQQKSSMDSSDKSLTKLEIDKFEEQLYIEREKLNGNTTADESKKRALPELTFLKSIAMGLQGGMHREMTDSANNGPTSSPSFANLTGSLRKSISVFGEQLKSIASGLNSYGDRHYQLPLTRIVDAVVNNKPHTLSDEYVIVDPKRPASDATFAQIKPKDKKKRSDDSSNSETAYSEVIVFVVGGGNYMEFHNLSELFEASKKDPNTLNKKKTRFTYGCTDILTGESFMRQLQKLGESIAK